MEIISLCTQLPLLLLLLGFWTVSAAAPDTLVIDTKNGKVQGKLLPVPGGNVRAFLGIPYGKPPLGKSRFRPPEPAEKWQGVRDATRFPNSCYQMPDTSIPGFKGIEMWNPNTPVSEDCLYLNVWTPNVNATQPSPPVAVLVWIYGGGFYVGTSSLDTYDGRFLSKSENVVVVSMNYRLGPLGFLSLPDNKNIPGNAGLLDQRLALQWVANNIGAFGGDPSKVTLFGESAGSLSVGLHLLSPGSQHLFHRAVMQSGSPNAFWGTVSQSEAWDRSLKLAKALDCSTSDPAALEACLQKADAEKITLKQHNVLTERHDILSLPFLPVVDGDVLPDKPEVLLSTGSLSKKELVIGLNKDEGPYFLINVVPGFSISGQSLITRNQFLHGVNLTMPDAAEVTKEAAIFHYTDPADENNSMKNRDLLCSLIGDQIFVAPVLEFAQRYSQRGGKTFLYLFDHRSSINPWPEWMGVLHGYEIEFVFGLPLNASLGYSKSEVNMTKKMMKHWANFARTGSPGGDGVNWPAFTAERQEYITLNCNPPEQKRMLRAKESELWNKLLPDIQRSADQLQACVTGNGIVPSCCYTFILILLATSFLFY